MPVSGRNATITSSFLALVCHSQRGGNAAAAGAAGENSFLLGQAAGPDETLFVVHLNHVVENFKVHGAGKNVFADAFDHVGVRLADFAGLHKFVVERADRDRRR